MSRSVKTKMLNKKLPASREPRQGKVDRIVCMDCYQGMCCRDGVEVDLLEVARILEQPLNIPKPWFEFLSRDKRFPSGFKFTTILRNRRCVFQDERMRCRIYEIRPRFCVEFPLEDGRKAPYYHSLCQHAKKKRKKGRVRR